MRCFGNDNNICIVHYITILDNERVIMCAYNGNERHSDQLMASK